MASELLCDRASCPRLADAYVINSPVFDDGPVRVCLCERHAKPMHAFRRWALEAAVRAAPAPTSRTQVNETFLDSLRIKPGTRAAESTNPEAPTPKKRKSQPE